VGTTGGHPAWWSSVWSQAHTSAFCPRSANSAQHAHARRAATPDATPGESSVLAVLRARLQERAGKEQELRARIRDLEQQLAVAHGEILTLRRVRACPTCGEQTSDRPRRRAEPICHERGAGG
jgi:hypothetical protein